MSAEKKTSGKKPTYRIPESDGFWAKTSWQASAVLALVGLGLCVFGFTQNPERFGYAYLFGFFTVLTFAFGGLFYVLALHFTGGHWGLTARRLAEIIGLSVVPTAILAIPLFAGVATGTFDLYDEWMGSHHGGHGEEHGGEHGEEHGDDHAEPAEGEGAHGEAEEHGSLFAPSVARAQEFPPQVDPQPPIRSHEVHTPQMEAAHHHIIEHKSGYLNQGRWFGFAALYFLIWIGLAVFYFRSSVKQDDAPKKERFELTNKMKKVSALGAIAFGLSLTFAAFDWLMALEGSWYSTIFGVVIFAGSAVAVLALIIVLGIGLHRKGHIGNALNVEHFHDLGKLMFGFMCFWAYVSFSQWMLIWYAGIPEEQTWYHKRWQDGWKAWALFMMIGHFGLPFYFLISRIVKRNLGMLRLGAIWLIFMHVCDIYVFVLPQYGGFGPSAIDFGALLFCGGVFFTFVFRMLMRVPLIPLGDPRLERALHHHQSH